MAVVYSTDFESEAALSDIFDVQTGGVAAFGTDQAEEGVRSLKFHQTGGSSAAVRTLPGDQVSVHRFWLRWSAAPGANEQALVIRDTPTGTTLAILFIRSNASLNLQVASGVGSGNSNSLSAPATNTWHAIDLVLDTSGTTWTANWQIDGVDQPDVTATGQTATGQGAARWCHSGANTFDWWVDLWQYADSAADYPLSDPSAGSTVDLSIGAIPSAADLHGIGLTVGTGLRIGSIASAAELFGLVLDVSSPPPTGFLVDTYQRTVADGIGTADTGQDGLIDQAPNTDYSVAPGALSIFHSAGDAPIWHYDVDVQHFDLEFTYSFDSLPTGTLQRIGPAWWVVGLRDYYRLSITQTTGGNTNLFVEQQVDNLDTTVPMDWGSGDTTATKALVTPQAADTVYHCRVKCYDDAGTTKFLVKVWPDGDAEPDDTPGTSGGSIVGLGSDIGGATQTHGGLGCRSQTLSGNTNEPTYSIQQYVAQNLDAGAFVGLDLGAIPSAAALHGVDLAAIRGLGLAAIPSPAALHGPALAATRGLGLAAIPSAATLYGLALGDGAQTVQLGLGSIPSPAALHGLSLSRAAALALGSIPSPAALHGLGLGLHLGIDLGHIPSPAALHGLRIESAILQSRYVVLCDLYDSVIVADVDNPEQLVHLALPTRRVVI